MRPGVREKSDVDRVAGDGTAGGRDRISASEIIRPTPAVSVARTLVLVVWYKTGMRIAQSARRHGVSDEAIRHAVANAIRLFDTDDGLFVIGADASGRMLELIARPAEAGDLVVFHAMPLRPVNAMRYLP